jgi:hypothetical protein
MERAGCVGPLIFKLHAMEPIEYWTARATESVWTVDVLRRDKYFPYQESNPDFAICQAVSKSL